MIKKTTVGNLIIIHCVCERCHYQWSAQKEEPIRCAKCRSKYWNKPKLSKSK